MYSLRPLPSISLVLGLAAIAVILSVAAPVAAQTTPELVLRPWGDEAYYAKPRTQVMFVNKGRVENQDEAIQLFRLDVEGRVRFDPQDADPVFAIGYHVNRLEIGEQNLPDLPSGTTDLAIVGGVQFGEVHDGWRLSATGGAGVANDNHFDGANGLYGIGSVNLSRELSPTSTLHFGLTYDGNRSVFPDVPLPYVTWQHQANDELFYAVGLPISNIVWRPSAAVMIEVRYLVPLNASGRVTYFINEKVSLFGEYRRTVNAYALHDRSDRRLFFEMSQASAGVTVKLIDRVTLTAGGGYAFEQEFSRGWDARDPDTLAELSDEPFFFLNLASRF